MVQVTSVLANLFLTLCVWVSIDTLGYNTLSNYQRLAPARIKPGFHTCVSRTHNGARCLTMYEHQWSQAITAFAIKACKLMLIIARRVPRCSVTVTYRNQQRRTQKRFSVLRKKEQILKAKKNVTTTFGKSWFLTWCRMRYAIYIPPNTKDLAINLWMPAYGNRQNAITFARANNSDLLRALKHLMETRL